MENTSQPAAKPARTKVLRSQIQKEKSVKAPLATPATPVVEKKEAPKQPQTLNLNN